MSAAAAAATITITITTTTITTTTTTITITITITTTTKVREFHTGVHTSIDVLDRRVRRRCLRGLDRTQTVFRTQWNLDSHKVCSRRK